MSKYTTGEIAKLCDITVRTVQYYDTRGILSPSELTEGGRRLYSDDDLRRMQIICFLRELGFSIDSIKQLLSEEHPENVIELLLSQQEAVLKTEIAENEAKLGKLQALQSGLKSMPELSVESIGDIAYVMKNQKELKKMRLAMLLLGIPLAILQISSIILWAAKGIWWLFAVWAVLAVLFGIFVSRWYFRKVDYLCPECHTVFKPSFKEIFFAPHTPAARKLHCPKCGHHGFCVEVLAEESRKSAES